jgi:hypothetical protein
MIQASAITDIIPGNHEEDPGEDDHPVFAQASK